MVKSSSLIYSLDTIDHVVDALYALMPHCSVFTFTGVLGSGKTTLIQHLLARCGIVERVVSPTFTYMIAYTNNQGQHFYHFDLYRMRTLQDFYDMGFGDMLYAPCSWSFIEWPAIVMPLLSHNACHITIDYVTEVQRILTYTCSPDV